MKPAKPQFTTSQATGACQHLYIFDSYQFSKENTFLDDALSRYKNKYHFAKRRKSSAAFFNCDQAGARAPVCLRQRFKPRHFNEHHIDR
jgi:hypothetical protein